MTGSDFSLLIWAAILLIFWGLNPLMRQKPCNDQKANSSPVPEEEPATLRIAS